MANTFLPTGVTQPNAYESLKFSWDDAFQKYSYLALVGLTGVLVYAFLNMFELTSGFWEQPAYSHGWIIPIIALYILWARRPNPTAQEPPRGEKEETFLGIMPCSNLKPMIGIGGVMLLAGLGMALPIMQYAGLGILCLGGLAYIMIGQPFQEASDLDRWIGAAIILAALCIRAFYAADYNVQPVNRVTFVIAIFGLYLLVGGWHLLKWAWPAIFFLFFMFPLPTFIENMLLGRLQRVAAMASEVVLTILSMPVIREGNTIAVDGVPLEVAAACSGLRMVTIFGAMALAMVFLAKRPWWDQLIIILSAIPIALIVNIVRIVVTAILLTSIDNEVLHKIIHDWAGFAMMPLAMGLLYLELKFLTMLSVPEESITTTAGGMSTFAPR